MQGLDPGEQKVDEEFRKLTNPADGSWLGSSVGGVCMGKEEEESSYGG